MSQRRLPSRSPRRLPSRSPSPHLRPPDALPLGRRLRPALALHSRQRLEDLATSLLRPLHRRVPARLKDRMPAPRIALARRFRQLQRRPAVMVKDCGGLFSGYVLVYSHSRHGTRTATGCQGVGVSTSGRARLAHAGVFAVPSESQRFRTLAGCLPRERESVCQT